MNRKRDFMEGTKRVIKEFKEIQAMRRLDIDLDLPKPIGTHRLLDRMIDYPEWKPIKEKLIKEPRREDLERFK